MSKIETRLFQYFVVTCEEENFSRAAERLGITPPTLTHQIKKLEEQVDALLLIRSGRTKFRITEAGKRFLEGARGVLHHAQEAEKAARSAARGEIGTVEFGYTFPIIYTGLIHKLIGLFRQKQPAVDMRMREVSTLALLEGILAKRLDAGFARSPGHYPPGVTGFPIYRANVVLAVPADHRLAKGTRPINAAELANENFISTGISYDLAFKPHAAAIAKLGRFNPRISKRAEDLATVLSYVSAGYGIAPVTAPMAASKPPNVVFKTLAERAAPRVDYVFIHRTDENNPATRSLIETIQPQSLK
jgi:DNA-binding transcriptional LysR family regulator